MDRVVSTKCEITIKASRPLPYCTIEECKTLGDHMRRKRLSLNESQPSVALKLSVSTETITCWELNRNEPQIHYTPRIIEYLGYCPLYDIAGSTLSTRVKQFMFLDGFTQKECAKKLGIDTSTLDRIIKNKKHKIISTSC